MGKPSIAFFTAISLISQLFAVAAMMQALNTAEFSLAIPAWQALSALTAAVVYGRAMPEDTRRFHAQAFSHCFVMCLFLPVVGLLLFVSLARHARQARATDAPIAGQTADGPRFDPQLLSQITYGPSRADTPAHADVSVGRARALMMNEGSLLEGRAGSLDRWLEHKDEEIRLMAFGIRAMAENAIVEAIDQTTQDLADATSDQRRARLRGRLAQLYWQLLDEGLVQSDMETMVVAACEEHAKEAVSLQPDLAQSWFLLGCCAIKRASPQEAFYFFDQAREHHFPDALVLPGIAKAAFLERDYRRVREALASLRKGTPPLSQKGVLEYWKP